MFVMLCQNMVDSPAFTIQAIDSTVSAFIVHLFSVNFA
jgi:hypothetical protein